MDLKEMDKRVEVRMYVAQSGITKFHSNFVPYSMCLQMSMSVRET